MNGVRRVVCELNKIGHPSKHTHNYLCLYPLKYSYCHHPYRMSSLCAIISVCLMPSSWSSSTSVPLGGHHLLLFSLIFIWYHHWFIWNIISSPNRINFKILFEIQIIFFTTSSHRILQVVDLCISIALKEWKESKDSVSKLLISCYEGVLMLMAVLILLPSVDVATHFDIMVCTLIIGRVTNIASFWINPSQTAHTTYYMSSKDIFENW